MESEADRERLESTVKARLAEYGIEAKNIYVDWDLSTVIVLCRHITGGMKVFMSKGNVSLGGTARDSMVTAHRIRVGERAYGMLVIYCKACFNKGVRMLFEEK